MNDTVAFHIWASSSIASIYSTRFIFFNHFSIVLFLPFVAAERGWGRSQFWVFVELLLFCCGLCAFGLQFLNNDTLSERKEYEII